MGRPDSRRSRSRKRANSTYLPMGTTTSSFSFESPSLNIAPEHERLTSQRASASARVRAARWASEWRLAHPRRILRCPRTSALPPASSRSTTGRPAWPRNTTFPVARSAQSTEYRSRNSQMAGCTLRLKRARTALKASVSVLNETRSVQRSSGLGISFRVASVTIPSIPSLPIQRSRRLNPAENFFVAVPHSTNSPVGRNPFSARTKSRVTPYLPPVHAAGVAGDVAADRAVFLRRGIRRIKPPLGVRRGLDGGDGRARLHLRKARPAHRSGPCPSRADRGPSRRAGARPSRSGSCRGPAP